MASTQSPKKCLHVITLPHMTYSHDYIGGRFVSVLIRYRLISVSSRVILRQLIPFHLATESFFSDTPRPLDATTINQLMIQILCTFHTSQKPKHCDGNGAKISCLVYRIMGGTPPRTKLTLLTNDCMSSCRPKIKVQCNMFYM